MASQAAREKQVLISTDVLKSKSASLSQGGTVLDDTNMKDSNDYRSRINGIKDWSVTASGPYDSSEAALTAIRTAWLAGTAVVVYYLPDGTNGFTGSAVVESLEFSGEVDGLETFQLTLQANGALTAEP